MQPSPWDRPCRTRRTYSRSEREMLSATSLGRIPGMSSTILPLISSAFPSCFIRSSIVARFGGAAMIALLPSTEDLIDVDSPAGHGGLGLGDVARPEHDRRWLAA